MLCPIGRNHFPPIRRFAMTQRYSALLAALFSTLMLSQAPTPTVWRTWSSAAPEGRRAPGLPAPRLGRPGHETSRPGYRHRETAGRPAQGQTRTDPGQQHQPHPVPDHRQGRPGDLQPRQKPGAEKVIDFSRAYAPFYLAVFGPPDADIKSLDDLKGKTISVTRGAIEDIELTKVALEGVTIKRFEDNNSTIAAYLAGQVDLIASGNVVMVAISEKSPKRVPALKVKLKDSPVYVGVNKNEPALLDKVNQILATAKS